MFWSILQNIFFFIFFLFFLLSFYLFCLWQKRERGPAPRHHSPPHYLHLSNTGGTERERGVCCLILIQLIFRMLFVKYSVVKKIVTGCVFIVVLFYGDICCLCLYDLWMYLWVCVLLLKRLHGLDCSRW